MTVKVVCPNPGCDASYSVSDERLGRRVRCKRCGNRFIAGDSSVPPTRGSSPGSGSKPGGSGRELPLTIGKYRVLRKLGQGGMGEVYLGRDDELARDVALKLPILNGDDDSDFLARFRREARAAAAFRHPNFCPIYDVGVAGDRPYLAMAFIEGQPLSELVGKNRPMDPAAAIALVRRIALAMAEAHDKKVVHRDLKPSNVMIDLSGEPIVMDFGLAWVPSADDSVKTVTGKFFGSAHYASPEQIRGDRSEIGPPTDIYSLGAILYELVTGRRPFEGPAHYALAQVFIAEPPPPTSIRPSLDRRFDAIIAKAMCKEISGRYRSMREFACVLEPLVDSAATGSSRPGSSVPGSNRPRPVAPPPKVKSPSAPARRFPLAALAAFGPLVLAIALGVVVYVATDSGTLRIEGADDQMVVTVDGREVRIEKIGAPIKIRTGEHGLTVTRGDVVVRSPKMFEITRGKETVLKVELVPTLPAVQPVKSAQPASVGKTAQVVPAPPKVPLPVVVETPKADPMPGKEPVKVDPKPVGPKFTLKVDPNPGKEPVKVDPKRGGIKGAVESGAVVKAKPAPPTGPAKVATEALDRGVALFKTGAYRAAIEALNPSIVAEPGAPALAHRALCRFFLGDYDGAISDAERAMLFDDRMSMPFLVRGLVRDELGDFTRAAEDLEKAADLNPDRASAHGFLASVLDKLQRTNDAKVVAQRSIRADTRDDLDRIGQAEGLLNGREFARALELLDEVIGRSPNYIAYIDRSAAHSGAGDREKALADLTSALDLAPGSPVARTFRARIKLDQSDHAAAISDLDEAIRLAPQFALAHGLRGRARLETNNYDDALTDLREAARLGVREVFVYERLGFSYNRRSEWDQAIEVLDKALTLDPKCDGALYERGVALERKGEHDRAIRDFNSTLELKPGYANALHWRGICRLELKDYDGAISDYTAVIEQEKQNVNALIGRARAQIGKMKFDSAIDDCTDAIKVDKKNAVAYDYRAIARDGKGESVGAEADREMAKSIRAEVPPAPKG